MNLNIAVTSKSFSKNIVLRETLLKKFPSAKFNDDGLTYTPAQLVEFLQDADKAIIGLEKINIDILRKAPRLKHISKYGVGLDNIDLDALTDCGVKLSWTGGVNRRGVAELALCFMLNLMRGVHSSNSKLQNGQWQTHIGLGLREVTVGIIGLGHVGQELAMILNFLGAKVVAHDIMDKSSFASTHKIEMLELDDLLIRSDIVSLHIPYNLKTKHIFSLDKFKLMKPHSFLVNTSRGGIVDEDALYTRLKEGQIAGAAFDVFEEEPCKNLNLLKLPNFLGTPHIAGSSNESVLAMGIAAIDGLDFGKEAKRENFFSY